jgi:hypothetical protein
MIGRQCLLSRITDGLSQVLSHHDRSSTERRLPGWRSVESDVFGELYSIAKW